MHSTWNVLVVEDEVQTQEYIESVLAKDPELHCVGVCSGVGQALKAIAKSDPDLLMLDIELADGTSFEILESLSIEHRPEIMFLTAYDDFAIKAFETHALDYLLKPFDESRLVEALQHVKARLKSAKPSHSHAQLLDALKKASQSHESNIITVKVDSQTLLKPISEIDRIESATNGVILHFGDEAFAKRESLTSLEENVLSDRFVRVHRSTIVNIDRIAAIEPWFHGDYVIKMKDGNTVKLSRRYKSNLEAKLNSKI